MYSLRLTVKESISQQLVGNPKPTYTDISNHIHLAKEYWNLTRRILSSTSSMGRQWTLHVLLAIHIMWQATTHHKYITTNLPAQPALMTVMVFFRNHLPIQDLKVLKLSHWFYMKKECVEEVWPHNFDTPPTRQHSMTFPLFHEWK